MLVVLALSIDIFSRQFLNLCGFALILDKRFLVSALFICLPSAATVR